MNFNPLVYLPYNERVSHKVQNGLARGITVRNIETVQKVSPYPIMSTTDETALTNLFEGRLDIIPEIIDQYREVVIDRYA